MIGTEYSFEFRESLSDTMHRFIYHGRIGLSFQSSEECLSSLFYGEKAEIEKLVGIESTCDEASEYR